MKLRPLTLLDTDDMFRYTKDEDTCRFMDWGPHTNPSQAGAFIENALKNYQNPSDILWGIEELADKKLIGVVRIYDITEDSGAVSYILNKAYKGKGYMTEAVKKVIEVCFNDLGLNSLFAYYADKNEASKRVMEHCGMTSTGAVREGMVKGQTTTMYEYRIKKGE